MKKIKVFYFPECPHCQLAQRLVDELKKEALYAELELEWINEKEEAELAERFDYYYVPCFYLDGEKLHEGHAERDDIRGVFDRARRTVSD